MIIANKNEISQMRVGNDEIGILVKKGDEIYLTQNLAQYAFSSYPFLKNKSILRNVPVDFVNFFDSIPSGPMNECYKYTLNDKDNTELFNQGYNDIDNKVKISKEIFPGQNRTAIDIRPTYEGNKCRQLLLDYNTTYSITTTFSGGEPYSTSTSTSKVFKTKKKKRFKQNEVIYINNYLKNAEEFRKTDFCTLQQCFKEMVGLEGTYTIELAKTGIPYTGPFYYSGKANIIIKGNGQTLLGENCGVLNNDEHQRSVFEWASSGTITFQNVTLKNQYTRNEYGFDNSAGETFGMTSGNVIAIKSTFTGLQDTLRLVGHGYFENCTIEGDVDFIWAESGFEAALFQNCTINCLCDLTRSSPNSCIVAPRMSKTPLVGKGIVIKDSTINIADNVRTYLGRNPWSSYNDWYNNASFINCNILSPTTNNSNTFVGGDTWLRLSRWSNAAASPTDSKYIGFKDYNLTLNGNPFTTKILKKTTTYNIVTEITTTDKTKTYVGKDYNFGIYTTLNSTAYIATGYKARFIRYSRSMESLKTYSNTLSFSDAKHYYEFVVGFPELNRTECDISKSNASEWLSFLGNKMTTVSGYTGTAYSIDDVISALDKALLALYSPALTGKTYKNSRSMWWSSSSSSGGIYTNGVIPLYNNSTGYPDSVYNCYTGQTEKISNTSISTATSTASLSAKLKNLCPFGRVNSSAFSSCYIASGQPDWNTLFNGASCKYGLTPRSCGYISAKNNTNYGCPLYAAVSRCNTHGTSCIWRNKGIYTNVLDEYGNIIGRKSTKSGTVPTLSADDKSDLVPAITQNGVTMLISDYCKIINKIEMPKLIIRKRSTTDGAILNTQIINLNFDNPNNSDVYLKSYSYHKTFTIEGEPITDIVIEDEEGDEDIRTGYRPYTGAIPADENSSKTLTKEVTRSTTLSGDTKTEEKVTTKVIRYKTVHYDLIDGRANNCPELDSADVSAEYAGANNILNRVWDVNNEKFITSPNKWTDYQEFSTISDSSSCGTDNNAITFIFGSNAFADTFEYNTNKVKGTITNKDGAVLNVDCSSGGKVTSNGRNTDIQFNKGAKISFNSSKNCRVYTTCYPGYGNIKITAGGTSASGESANLDISDECTVTLESLNDTSYLQAIYIIKG